MPSEPGTRLPRSGLNSLAVDLEQMGSFRIGPENVVPGINFDSRFVIQGLAVPAWNNPMGKAAKVSLY